MREEPTAQPFGHHDMEASWGVFTDFVRFICFKGEGGSVSSPSPSIVRTPMTTIYSYIKSPPTPTPQKLKARP